MLELKIELEEAFDEETESFVATDYRVLELEHSLVSISKWEAKYEKAFLKEGPKDEELLDYIYMMIITPGIERELLNAFQTRHFEKISEYIGSKQTATTFAELSDSKKGGPERTITSELIYYWMVAMQIPWEAQTWNLNRLITLIKVAQESQKKSDGKKMSAKEIAARNKAINEQRKKQYGTKG